MRRLEHPGAPDDKVKRHSEPPPPPRAGKDPLAGLAPVMSLDPDELLRPRQVRELFGVHSSTLIRWEGAGYIRSVRTPGGTRRYLASDVQALLTQGA